MASSCSSSSSIGFAAAFLVLFLLGGSSAQLNATFYAKTCPNVFTTVKSVVQAAVKKETRMGASLLRLFFHDCFVHGCDASILLDNGTNIVSEKTAGPNLNSVRGFEVIDNIKSAVEKACPGVVSCADILAISARDSVVILGGPSWDVKLGRRDSTQAFFSTANNGAIPAPTSSLATLKSAFQNVGLSEQDLVALAGAHTIGQARCTSFRARLYNETNLIDTSFASTRKTTCPSAAGNGDNNLAPLDVQTSAQFDNKYYANLVANRGLLHSDQQLFSGGSTNSLVTKYNQNQKAFQTDFVTAIIKMGDISPPSGSSGQIRKNCRTVN